MPYALQPPVKLNKKTTFRVTKSATSSKPILTVPLSTSMKLKQRLQTALSKLMAESALNTASSQNGLLILNNEKQKRDAAIDSQTLQLSLLKSNPSKILLSSTYLNNYQYLQQKNKIHINSRNHRIFNTDTYRYRGSTNFEECLSSSPSSTDVFDMSPSGHPFNSHLTDTDTSDLDIVGSASANITSSNNNHNNSDNNKE